LTNPSKYIYKNPYGGFYMKQIDVDVEVFAYIWSNRQPAEMDENAVLRRLLLSDREYIEEPPQMPSNAAGSAESLEEKLEEVILTPPSTVLPRGKGAWSGPTWLSDVFDALCALGGSADLDEIYRSVRALRRKAGRTLPVSTDAVIRKTLEENSSDSDAHRGYRDIFEMPHGRGRGFWAIRAHLLRRR
jgi:hypothetical protein